MSETAGARLARLLAMVPWLRRNDGVTIAQAAAHFCVSEEQLTTDLWQLIVCGVPGYGPDQLVDIQFWDDDRIHVLDPITLERPLRLTGEEAAALVVALRLLAQVPGDHDRAALQSAVAKVESAAGAAGAIDMDVVAESEIDGTISAMVTEAIATGGGLEVDYASARLDAITTRRIAPHASFTVDGRVYVEAWCDQAQALRTFRLDRIVSASPAPPPPGHEDPENLEVPEERPAPVVTPTDSSTARIAVAPEAAWVWDTDPVASDGGSWNGPVGTDWPTGTIAYASAGWLVRYVLGRGGLVSLLEPADLRTEVLRQARSKAEYLRAEQAPSG